MTPEQRNIAHEYENHFSQHHKDLVIEVREEKDYPYLFLKKGNTTVEIKITGSDSYIGTSVKFESEKFGNVQYWSDSIYSITAVENRITDILERDYAEKSVKLTESIITKLANAGFKIRGEYPYFSAIKDHLKAKISRTDVIFHKKNQHGNFIQCGRAHFYVNDSEADVSEKYAKLYSFTLTDPVDRLTLDKLPEPFGFSSDIFEDCKGTLELNNTIVYASVSKIVTLDENCHIDDSIEKPSDQDPWFLVECNVRNMYQSFIEIIYRNNKFYLLSGNTKLKVTTEHKCHFNELDRMLLERVTENYRLKILGKEPNWDQIKRKE